MNGYVDGVHPRFSVVGHAPLSTRGGCWTFSVIDRKHGETAFGPTTDQREAARVCDFLSRPGEAAAVIDWAVDVARQMALVGMEA